MFGFDLRQAHLFRIQFALPPCDSSAGSSHVIRKTALKGIRHNRIRQHHSVLSNQLQVRFKTIHLRTLSGVISVQTSSTYARHSAFFPIGPTRFQPVAPYILGNSRQMPSNINLSTETNRSLLGLARRSTLICCLSTRISASSATRDRNRSPAIAKINRHKSGIGNQHRAILSQLPARLNLRQGQGAMRQIKVMPPVFELMRPQGEARGRRRRARLRKRIPHPSRRIPRQG
jgi:hypothetical protein